ncbi:hypothetical protein [Haloferax denitrificans]|uniref:hypothetical protein n=1 Tax=Haloferax denitrificans TaxID=35745 RepID=UPI001268D9D0|nr:hypothetical protein [Haloferax denitrificans]
MSSDEQTWVKVLLLIFQRNMSGDSFTGLGYHIQLQKRSIALELDAPESEVYAAIKELKDRNLIKEPPAGNRKVGYQVTKEGLDLATRIEQRKKEADLNKSVVLLTVALVVVGIVQFVVTGLVGHDAPVMETNLSMGTGIVFLVVILVVSLDYL